MKSKQTAPAPLHVDVQDIKGESIRDARVSLQSTDSKVKPIQLTYDTRILLYVVKHVSLRVPMM